MTAALSDDEEEIYGYWEFPELARTAFFLSGADASEPLKLILHTPYLSNEDRIPLSISSFGGAEDARQQCLSNIDTAQAESETAVVTERGHLSSNGSRKYLLAGEPTEALGTHLFFELSSTISDLIALDKSKASPLQTQSSSFSSDARNQTATRDATIAADSSYYAMASPGNMGSEERVIGPSNSLLSSADSIFTRQEAPKVATRPEIFTREEALHKAIESYRASHVIDTEKESGFVGDAQGKFLGENAEVNPRSVRLITHTTHDWSLKIFRPEDAAAAEGDGNHDQLNLIHLGMVAQELELPIPLPAACELSETNACCKLTTGAVDFDIVEKKLAEHQARQPSSCPVVPKISLFSIDAEMNEFKKSYK